MFEDTDEGEIPPTQIVPSVDVLTQFSLRLLRRTFEDRVREGMHDFHDLLIELSEYESEHIQSVLNSLSLGGISLHSHITASGIVLANYPAINAAIQGEAENVEMDKENQFAPVRIVARK